MTFRFARALRRPHRPDPLDITEARDEIRETIHLPTRANLIETALDRGGTEVTRDNAELTKLRQHRGLLDGHPGHEPGAEIESRGNLSLAGTFAAGGFLAQLAANKGAFGEYGDGVVLASAIGMEVAMGAVGVSVLKSLNNTVRPEATLRAGKKISIACTGALFAAGATLAYARFTTAATSDLFFTMAGLSLWAIAELAPFVAGLWAGLAYLRAYPHRVSEQILDLEERIRDLEKFTEWLREERRKVQQPPTAPSDSTRTSEDADGGDDSDAAGGAVGSIIKAASLVLAISIAAGSASAQTCGLSVDRSIIGVPASRAQAVENVLATLDELTVRRECSTLVVSAFAEGGSFTTPRVSIPVPPRRSATECNAQEPVQVDRLRAGLTLFGGFRDHVRDKSMKECAAERARTDSLFAERWNRFLRHVRLVVFQDQLTLPTAAGPAAEIRAYSEAGIRDVFIVASGLDTGAGIPDRLPPGVRVLLVQFEIKEAYLGRAAADAASERWRKAGATVLASPLVTPGVWSRLVLPSTK